MHLNKLDPNDSKEIDTAFVAASLSAVTLLHQTFPHEAQQYSRELDPIIGVSFTGLFDFFVNKFGVDWLRWWAEGRPHKSPEHKAFAREERRCLNRWKKIVRRTVTTYCEKNDMTVPNRFTTVQPAGSKSLLTGASPGWHPPKAARFIRRITFGKNNPVALACMEMGYSVIPSQTDKDENHNLLTDPFDPRCTEWLVEMPVKADWADLEGVDEIDISKFSALAQFDFYMQVQKNYTTDNTSATLELTEAEIKPLAKAIHRAIEKDEGYISAALLARFESLETFPRMPFEPIDKETYDRLEAEMHARRKVNSFEEALDKLDTQDMLPGIVACDSDKCLLPEKTV